MSGIWPEQINLPRILSPSSLCPMSRSIYFQYSEPWPFEHITGNIDGNDYDNDDEDNKDNGNHDNNRLTDIGDSRPGYHAFSNFPTLESNFPLQIWAT